MKIDMSPKAIENRLKLVGKLTKACVLIRKNSLQPQNESAKDKGKNQSQYKNPAAK